MTHELVLYTHPMSRGRICRWMLEEVGQPYRAELLDYRTTMKDSAYLAINPMGKVPALQHGEVVVTECAAICMYLAEAFPEAGLAPAIGAKQRGAYLRWMFFGAGPMEAAGAIKALGVDVPTDKQGSVGWRTVEQQTRILESVLEQGPYFLGDAFSAVDVYVGSILGWGMRAGTLPASAVFTKYVAAIMQRPAAVRAFAIDDAHLKANE